MKMRLHREGGLQTRPYARSAKGYSQRNSEQLPTGQASGPKLQENLRPRACRGIMPPCGSVGQVGRCRMGANAAWAIEAWYWKRFRVDTEMGR